MKNRIITILLECLIFLIGAGVSSAQTVSSITVYEDSSGVQPFNFLITDPALYNTGSIDFRQLVGEDYDLYFSDEDGTLSANGMYLTITCTHNYFFNENSAANNIDAVSLNFSDGSKAWASIVTSYTLGWNQTLGWANLGAALGQPDGISTRVGSQYSSLTVGFGSADYLSVAPSELVFENTLVDEISKSYTVTVTNTTAAPLNITSNITGASAEIFAAIPGPANGCSVPNDILLPDELCTLEVTFAPTAYGPHTALLVVASTDLVSLPVGVPLSGVAVYKVTPSVIEGTLGTTIVYNDTPSASGTKKGRVLIGGLRQKVNTWTPTFISVTVKKIPLPGETAYDVSIEPKPKGTPTINLPGGFTVKKPEIDESTSDGSGAYGSQATIKGMWFGTKKGKIYLDGQKCGVKYWNMDSTTGASTAVFVVSRKRTGTTRPTLRVHNAVGFDEMAFSVYRVE